MGIAKGHIEWAGGPGPDDMAIGTSIMTVHIACTVVKNKGGGFDAYIHDEVQGNFSTKEEGVKHLENMLTIALEQFNEIL
jgi:hypothetical protein